MSPKKGFADAVKDSSEVLRKLISTLEIYDSCLVHKANSIDAEVEDTSSLKQERMKYQQKQWSILESLASTPSVAKLLVTSSAWLELLGIVAGYSKFTKDLVGRQGATNTLHRLLWDPSTSPIAGKNLSQCLSDILLFFQRVTNVFQHFSFFPRFTFKKIFTPPLANDFQGERTRYYASDF